MVVDAEAQGTWLTETLHRQYAHAHPAIRARHVCVRSIERSSPTAKSSNYDNPALYSANDNFSDATYWNRKYDIDRLPFEWYRGWQSLEPLLLKYLPPQLPILQVGVGTSTIQHDMVIDGGYTRVVNLDYADVCIERMSKMHADVPALEYVMGDVKKIDFEDQSFGGILDKGTLDALLCGDCAEGDAHKMMIECSRLLQPGCSYFMVTHGPPPARLSFLNHPEYGWDILVHEVGQQGIMSPALQLTGDPESVNAASEDVTALPRLKYSHFVYICTKHP
eukprot:gene31305-6453_t